MTVQVDATSTEALTVEMSIDSGAFSPMNLNADLYEAPWDTTELDDGTTHTIDARATDSKFKTTTATQVSVTVDNALAATGAISGTVTNFNGGSPIAGATVFISGQLKAKTDAVGSYTIFDVPVGTHTVKAKAKGFVSASEDVTVSKGGPATRNFALTPR